MHEIQEGEENISCKDAADFGDRRLLVLLFGGAGGGQFLGTSFV